MRDSRWEECKEKRKVKGWALGTLREAYEKVVKEEAGRLGIVREILRNVRSARIATVFFWTFFGGYRRRRSTAVVGGVQSMEKHLNAGHPTGFW